MKKEYLHPEMDVVLLTASAALLAGSETLGIFDDDETDQPLAPPLGLEPDLMPDLTPGLPGLLK